jgi:hypothetical protein
MNKYHSLHYYIHNIKASIDCPNDNVRQFIEKSFFFFKKKQKYKFQINISIDLSSKKNFANLSKKINKIGNNILLDKKKLIFQNHGLIYEFINQKKKISVNVKKQTNSGIFLKSKNIVKKILFETDVYSIFRQSIILPIIWILSRKFNIHSLHGGATSLNRRGYIFSGLAGVAKSNLTLFMTIQNRFKFLSDNFLLFDKNFIYPFPEWIRVIDDSKKIMPELNKFFETKKLKRNKKNYYLLPNKLISQKVKPKIFIFTEIGSKCKLKKIKKDYTIKRILLSKDQVKEFPEQNFIALLDLLNQDAKLFRESELITLKKFLNKTKSFIFTINKNITIKENLEFLIKKTNNV